MLPMVVMLLDKSALFVRLISKVVGIFFYVVPLLNKFGGKRNFGLKLKELRIGLKEWLIVVTWRVRVI